MQAGRPAGRYLVLLYLVRGRLSEALRAFSELRNSLPEAQTGAPIVTPLNWSFHASDYGWLCGSTRPVHLQSIMRIPSRDCLLYRIPCLFCFDAVIPLRQSTQA